MAQGKKTGGRKKGSLNKATMLLSRQEDPLVKKADVRIQEILEGKLLCGVCRGKKKTSYKLARGVHAKDCAITLAKLTKGQLVCSCDGIGQRTCESCYGDGLERLSPELIAKVSLDIREYGYPKLKSIEHSGPGGGPIQVSIAESILVSRAKRMKEGNQVRASRSAEEGPAGGATTVGTR